MGKPTKPLTYNSKIWLISKINNFIHVFSASFELLWSLITWKSNLKVMFGVTPTQIDWLLIKWRHHSQNSNFSLSKHVIWYHIFRLSLLSPFLCRKRFHVKIKSGKFKNILRVMHKNYMTWIFTVLIKIIVYTFFHSKILHNCQIIYSKKYTNGFEFVELFEKTLKLDFFIRFTNYVFIEPD